MSRQFVAYGNSFWLAISLQRYTNDEEQPEIDINIEPENPQEGDISGDVQLTDIEGEYIPFDLTQCKDIKMYLLCEEHGTKIYLDYSIVDTNIIKAFIKYTLLHPNTAYGVVVEGYDQNDVHFRWTMSPEQGIYVTENTSGSTIQEGDIIDLSGRVGWSSIDIELNFDPDEYYNKSQIDDTFTTKEYADETYATKTGLNTKQDTLISSENIKTVNGESILGSGNITIVGQTGPQGATGKQGIQGPQGLRGEKGDTGVQGATGERGPRGLQGERGLQGQTGLQGPAGATGKQGVAGATGPRGERGATGPQGPTGKEGKIGPTGAKGNKGDTGQIGPTGKAGATGPTGPRGIQGPTGPKGNKGDTGPAGATGKQGVAGATGPRGERGATGPQGPTGKEGKIGPTGPKGDTVVGVESINGATGIVNIKSINNESLIGIGNITIDAETIIVEYGEQISSDTLAKIYANPGNVVCHIDSVVTESPTYSGLYAKLIKIGSDGSLEFSYYYNTFGDGNIAIPDMEIHNYYYEVTSNNEHPNGGWWHDMVRGFYNMQTISRELANKQDTLVSGTNIKTINNESILGTGNIDIQGGDSTGIYVTAESLNDLDYRINNLRLATDSIDYAIENTNRNIDNISKGVDDRLNDLKNEINIGNLKIDEQLKTAAFVFDELKNNTPTGYVVDYSKRYLTFEVLSAGTITIKANDSLVEGKTISYSTDNGTTWNNLTTSTTEQSFGTFAIGDTLLLKGNNETYGDGYITLKRNHTINGTAQTKLSGNIMSLIYGDNFKDKTTFPNNTDCNFEKLFYNYTNLKDASDLILPATTLNDNCYHYMFYGCTSLVKAPELPATTLAANCYRYMFSGCTSLVKAPELPATTLPGYCYNHMFEGCTKLNYIKALFTDTPVNQTNDWVTNVASTGIFIKSNKATITNRGNNGIPENWEVYVEYATLGATGAQGPQGATGAVGPTGPTGPAGGVTIDDYVIDYSKRYLTFEVLSAGTITIKADSSVEGKTISYSTDNGTTWNNLITSTTEQSFGTFDIGDTLLLKGNNTSISEKYYYTNINGTAQTKVSGNIMSLLYGDDFKDKVTFPNNNTWIFAELFKNYTNLKDASNLILPATALTNHCYAYMFKGCTSLTAAPELPSTTLADNCYYEMFSGCTSLTKAPELPATKLEQQCYWGMFQGCTSLTKAPELPAKHFYPSYQPENYNYMFCDCTSLNYIKALFTDWPGTDKNWHWVTDVSATGVFIKSNDATWTTVGGYAGGTPENWNVYVENATQTPTGIVTSTTNGLKIEVVSSMPATGINANTIYIVQAQ